jgi:5-deoxy-glucuronate isomerase
MISESSEEQEHGMQQESVVRARNLPQDQAGEMVGFTRQEAGWEWMSFVVRRLLPGQQLELRTEGEEMVLVLLGGSCLANWGTGEQSIGARANVFDGLPYALYLPDDHRVTVKAESVCEIAECRVPSEARLEPRLVTPKDVASGLRGGENASRQIVEVIPSSFPADKLVVFEVYTPGGNWSSYPPHKHDVDQPPAEVDLDEIYYYRMKDARGFALQNLYRSDRSRESLLKVHDGDVVLVRDGYHPVVAGPGYDTYYLNFLAGTSRTMAVTEDPEHLWLRSTWKQTDPRLPLVHG